MTISCFLHFYTRIEKLSLLEWKFIIDIMCHNSRLSFYTVLQFFWNVLILQDHKSYKLILKLFEKECGNFLKRKKEFVT